MSTAAPSAKRPTGSKSPATISAVCDDRPVGSWREQALIDAPLEEVWELVGDPRRYPEWAEDFLEITGPPTVDLGAEYQSVLRNGLDQEVRTPLEVETLEDMHAIQLRCPQSGWYAGWVLTAAGGGTFVDVEIGMDPYTEEFRQADELFGKRWYRRMARGSIDGIKRTLARPASRT